MKIFLKNFAIMLFLFLFIFGTQFKYIQINSAYVFILILIILNLKKVYKFFSHKKILIYVMFLITVGFYSLTLSYLYNFDNYFLKILISVIIYIMIGYILVDNIEVLENEKWNKLNTMIYFLVIAITFNSFIIIVEYFNIDFKYFIENLLIENTMSQTTYLDHPFRIRGFAISGGASLSVLIAFTILFVIYLFLIKKISFNFIFLSLLILNISNIFTGRTGLLLGLLFTSVFVIILLYKSFLNHKILIKIVSLITIFIILFLLFFQNFKLNSDVIAWAFELFINFSDSGNLKTASSNELLTMFSVPDNILHLLFGIGFYEGNNPLQYLRSDVGYIKTIFSIGLLLTIGIYFLLFYLIYKLKYINKITKIGVPIMIVILILLEFKEPFLYQNYFSRVIFVLVGAYIYLKYTYKNSKFNKLKILND